MRVRTTCSKPNPKRFRAFSILRMVCTVCAYISPGASTLPEGSVPVVPETCTTSPTCTARAYPTLGSQGVPEKVLFRLIFICRPPYSTSQRSANRCGVRALAKPFQSSVDGLVRQGQGVAGALPAPPDDAVFLPGCEESGEGYPGVFLRNRGPHRSRRPNWSVASRPSS